ncbi:MAG: lipopolysaccharide biosynthesis protein [Hyphomicrobiales bacterium]|nr:lipopolysaccharide biosynthesis protein [Hyphomicrobiales bacterium]
MAVSPEQDREVPTDSSALKFRALSGAAVNLFSQAAKVAIQFASVIVLARLLSPTEFGVFGMVIPITAFVQIFQDLGLSQAVISSPTLTYGQLSSMFWINLALSVVLAIVLAACAPLLASLYHDQRVMALTLALAGTIPLSGLMTQHFALLTRQMRFTWLAVLDVLALLAGFLGSVVVALIWPSYWALFASVLMTMLVLLAGSWIGARWLPSRPAAWDKVRPMLHFGGGVIGYNISIYFARNLDKVLIGWRTGPFQLGLYDRAYKLLLLPLQNLNGPIARVMVPVLSRLSNDPERYRRVYLRTTQQILLAAFPGVVFMMATASTLIPRLLGSEWAGAAPIFTWLGLAGLHLPMSGTMAWLFVSQSRTTEYARWGFFNAATCIAGFAVGLPWGAYGVAVVYGLTDLFIRLPALWWYVGRRGPVRTHDLYRLAFPFAAAGVIAAAALWGIETVVSVSPFPYLIIACLSSYATTAAVLAMFPDGRAALRESYHILSGYVNALRQSPKILASGD